MLEDAPQHQPPFNRIREFLDPVSTGEEAGKFDDSSLYEVCNLIRVEEEIRALLRRGIKIYEDNPEMQELLERQQEIKSQAIVCSRDHEQDRGYIEMNMEISSFLMNQRAIAIRLEELIETRTRLAKETIRRPRRMAK